MAKPREQYLLMSPGPVQYTPEVLRTLSLPTPIHYDPYFVSEFSSLLSLMNVAFGAPNSQPFVISGSGTLGYDIAMDNILLPCLHKKPKVVVLNTGKFGDRWTEFLLRQKDIEVIEYKVPNHGNNLDLQKVSSLLKTNHLIYAIVVVHVETSTGVKVDLQALSNIIKQHHPKSFFIVDAMGSIMCEDFRFDEWGVDFSMCNSQKSVGSPPGLLLLMVSTKAMEHIIQHKDLIKGHYINLNNWLPIMQAYKKGPNKNSPWSGVPWFATPNANLILATNESLKQLLANGGMKNVVNSHRVASGKFRAGIKAMGLRLLPEENRDAGMSMTAVFFPNNVKWSDFNDAMRLQNVVVGSGTLKDIRQSYFRVGHTGMHIQTKKGTENLLYTLQAIEMALITCNYRDFPKGAAVLEFNKFDINNQAKL